jgi:hypothetical protein
VKASALIVATALLSGCATENGRTYPIIGFGWVTVSTNQPSVTRYKSTLIGVGAAIQPSFQCIAGYGHSEVVVAETNSVSLEIK